MRKVETTVIDTTIDYYFHSLLLHYYYKCTVYIEASGLGNFISCKRFAIQTLLWSLELVIHQNLEHNTIIELFCLKSEAMLNNDFGKKISGIYFPE